MSDKRVLSIDIFRGFTIFMMVFVNDLAGVSNIPQWMKHMPADADAMTFVDVVFPAFLFIVGMVIPTAIQNRINKGQKFPEIAKHILIRTVGLLILGFYMVNSEEMNKEATLMPKSIWNILLYLSAIFIWNQYPKTEDKQKNYMFWGLRGLGALILIILAFVYRKGTGDHIGGMTPSWWGILGLIGWAYLISTAVYLIFKNNQTAITATLTTFIFAVLAFKSENLEMPSMLAWLKGQSGHFAHAALVLAGMIPGILFVKGGENQSHENRLRLTLIAGLFFLIGGFLTRPFYGISKIYATPSWVLHSAAICCFIFALIYWIVDVKGISTWANFLKPAGSNPLLTYILPSLFYAIVGFSYVPEMLGTGVLGFFKSVIFSLFILAVSAFLTKRNIKLHL